MAVRPQCGHSCDIRPANFYDTAGWTGDEKCINQRVLAMGDERLQSVTHLKVNDCLKRTGKEKKICSLKIVDKVSEKQPNKCKAHFHLRFKT